MLSMYTNELNIIKLLRNGADGYLVKDCSPSELHSAILHIYHGGVYYPTELLARVAQTDSANVSEIFPELSA